MVDSSILIAICDEVNVRFVRNYNSFLPGVSKASVINITAFIPPAFRGPNPVGVSINALLLVPVYVSARGGLIIP